MYFSCDISPFDGSSESLEYLQNSVPKYIFPAIFPFLMVSSESLEYLQNSVPKYIFPAIFPFLMVLVKAGV